MAHSHTRDETGTLLPFPRTDRRGLLGAAMKHHRLPESLAGALVHEAAQFPEISADAALAYALAQRIAATPIDFARARGIVLAGPMGAGKSAVAAKILRAATLMGRKTAFARADSRQLRGPGRVGAGSPELLTVMEADGFNPLNVRAASAFRALGDIESLETIGVVSALNDAEDVSDIVAAFRFRRVIVTNMDRTRRLGAALAAITGGAGLAHVTYGPQPEDGLKMLEPGALAALLLDTHQH